jgi:hypothetical protein
MSEELLTPPDSEAYYSVLDCALRDPYTRVVIISRDVIQSVRMELHALSHRYFSYYWMDRRLLRNECAAYIIGPCIRCRITHGLVCVFITVEIKKQGKLVF